MSRQFKTKLVFTGGGLIILAFGLSGAFFFLERYFTGYYLTASPIVVLSDSPENSVQHLSPPVSTRALYLTQCAAASPAMSQHLLQLASTTEINAVVVDLKDYSGTVIFPSATALPDGGGCTFSDFAELVEIFHQQNLYVIGRLTAFQDPLYTKKYPEQSVQNINGEVWRDFKGLSFVDVNSQPFWDYLVNLASEAYHLGVDEINFDYVRYPSDGNMANIYYQHTEKTKAENLENFFIYLHKTLSARHPELILSVDLFGMTATNEDDLNIGQVLERALPYFDYIDPMVYPSHYPPNFNGWSNPNQHPYDIVRFSLEQAITRTLRATTTIASLAYERMGTSTPAIYRKPSYPASKIRPWLQDFNYPVPYTAEMVRTQIQATYDSGLQSWLLWDPANRYTPAALLPS